MRAKLLGLSLSEIKELVEYAIDGRCGCLENRLLALVEAKLSEIDQRMIDLAAMKGELKRYKEDLAGRLAAINSGGSESQGPPPVCHCLETNQTNTTRSLPLSS